MRKILILTTTLTLTLFGCEKGTGYEDPSLEAIGAKVKFVHTSWNAPSIIFYGRDTTFKFSAALVATGGVLQGTAFGSTYPSNDYAILSPYADLLKVRVPANSTTSPNAFVEAGNINIETGKNYSIFLIDSFPKVSTLILTDNLKNFNTIADSTFSARFVNTVYGSPALEIFSKNENAIVAANIPYKGVVDFKDLKVHAVQDEFQLRVAGTPTIIAKLLFTPATKKTYTLFARGRFGSTITASAPTLTFYTNQ